MTRELPTLAGSQRRVGPVPVYELTEPAAMQQLLQTNHRNSSKEQSYINHAQMAICGHYYRFVM